MVNNRYLKDQQTEALKLPAKAVYSNEFRDRLVVRVAVYTRVSTDNIEQATSLEIQQAHYITYVGKQEGWVLTQIYADEGVTGTNTKHRDQFNKMLDDARAGAFDLVITKSVSRYARNLLDGIRIARELLHLPVPVGILFEEEGLNTFRPDSEFILSVMLMMAQGESEKKSSAVKKAFQWRCDAQNYLTPVNNLLGYEKDVDGHMVIEPEGAKTVLAIYAMFLNGFTQSRIAAILTDSGKLTAKDNPAWSASSVLNILRNEKFCGDVVAQKTVTTDVLEHKSERNRGQLPLHYKDNHHAQIVSRKEYVRALLLTQARTSSPYYNPYYQVRAIRSGLLAGFIPINCAFGGYLAAHYMGAENMCALPALGESEARGSSDIQIVRAQDLNGAFAAQLTISHTGFSFNTNCGDRLPGTERVEILIHPSEKLIAIRPTDPSNRDGIPWPIRDVSAAGFNPILYELMGWTRLWKYKVTAEHYEQDGEHALLFDMNDPEYLIYEAEVKSNDTDQKKTIIRRVGGPKQAARWRSDIGADPAAWAAANRRAFARTLERLDISAPALPITGYDANPSPRTETELREYLDNLGVRYAG